MSDVHIAVVGTGPAGIAAAVAAAEAGARVTLIDEHPIDSSMMGLDIPYLFGQRMTPTVRDEGLMLQRIIDANPGIGRAQEAGVDVLPGVYVWGASGSGRTAGMCRNPCWASATTGRRGCWSMTGWYWPPVRETSR